MVELNPVLLWVDLLPWTDATPATSWTTAPADMLAHARRLVAPHLADASGWRAHGLGMAQKYVGPNLRLHVWAPELFGFNADERTHSHRCAMQSHVLLGSLCHTEVTVGAGSDYTIASFTSAEGEPVVVDVVGTASIVEERPMTMQAGMVYEFAAGAYHRAAVDDVAITLVYMGPKAGPSFALFPAGVTPRHAHGQTDGSVARVLNAVQERVKSWA